MDDDTVYGDGIAMPGESTELIGGNDLVVGGAGNDVLYGDGGLSMKGEWDGFEDGEAATLEGGDDRVVGGTGDDVLWGDGDVFASDGFAELLGGADTFVFRLGYGQDRFEHFRSGDGDVVELAGTGLGWSDLDTDESGTLDDADEWASITDGLAIDIGAATDTADEGEDVLTVVGLTELAETDFLFV